MSGRDITRYVEGNVNSVPDGGNNVFILRFPVTRIDIKSCDNNRDEAINSNLNKLNYEQNFIQIFP